MYLLLLLVIYRIPISESSPVIPPPDVRYLINAGLYVDKSLLIKELLKKSDKVSFIVRPNGWGKTTNLDMLKRFLELQEDEQGRPLTNNRTSSWRLFNGDATNNLPALRIARAEYIMKHQGRYPVIFLSFRNVSSGVNFEEIKEKTGRTISRLFVDRADYLTANLQTDVERSVFEDYRHGRWRTEADYGRSLIFLSTLLRRRYENGVYILIDDYDRPINVLFRRLVERNTDRSKPQWIIYEEASRTEQFNRTLNFLENILHACLKENPSLKQAVVSGTYVLDIPDRFERLSDVPVYTCLDTKLSTFYGFTEDDVDYLITAVGTSNVDTTILRRYYAYNYTGNGLLYNPKSVMRFLLDKDRSIYKDNYYSETFVDDMLADDRMQVKCQNFVDGGSIAGMVPRRIKYDRIWDELSLMTFAGYLGVRSRLEDVYDLAAPNREVSNIFQRAVLKWTMTKFNVSLDDLVALADSLKEFRTIDFENRLRRLTSSFANPNLLIGQRSYIYYNGLMTSVLYSLNDDYVLTDRFRPTDQFEIPCTARISADRRDGIVIGTRIFDNCSANNLTKEATVMLEQICRYSNLKLAGDRNTRIKRLLKVGVAFCGQLVALDYTVFQLE